MESVGKFLLVLPTLFRTVPSPTPYGLRPLPQDCWLGTPPKTSIDIISGTGKARDFKSGRYIHRSWTKSAQIC